MIEIGLNRIDGDYGFEARDAAGHLVRIDSSVENGGTNFGVRPMQLVLMALGGCSGIDIVSVLKKQRQQVEGFSVKITGEREKGKEPSLWENIHVIFELRGTIDPEKAEKACALSMDKYCSVAATLRPGGTKISWEVKVKGTN